MQEIMAADGFIRLKTEEKIEQVVPGTTDPTLPG